MRDLVSLDSTFGKTVETAERISEASSVDLRTPFFCQVVLLL